MRPFTEQFIEYAEESTDAPRLLLEWSAIWALSMMMGNKIYFEYGPGHLSANIWLIIIGGSSIRKSTSFIMARDLMKEVNRDMFFPQGWSKEALWQIMATNSYGTFFYDEAKSFFDCCSANYNVGVINDLTTLFSGESLYRETKKEKIEIIKPYVGFAGASTPEWMIDGIKDKQSAILSGFLPRFILIKAPASGRHYPWFRPTDSLKRNALIDQLLSVAKLNGVMRYDEEAQKAFEHWDAVIFKRIVDLEKHALPYTPFLNKISTMYPHKLAMIAAMDEGTFPIITMAAWTKAERWLSTIEASLYELLGSLVETPWDKLREKAVDYLVKKLDCTREQFGDETRIKGRTADLILKGLENDGKITIRKMEKSTKPITILQWVGNGGTHALVERTR